MSKVRTGIVMEINNNKACIMTSSGEFINVKSKGQKPAVGSEFTGESIVIMPSFRNVAIAASLILFLLTGSAAYAYSKPVATVTLSSPSVMVEINRWNRIVKTIPLDNEAKDILNTVNVNNKSLNDGLNAFIDEIQKKKAAKENINKNEKIVTEGNDTDNQKSANANTDKSKSSNKIVVYVDNKKNNSKVNLSKFKEHATKSNINVDIAKTNEKHFNPPSSNKNGKGYNGNNKKSDNWNKK